jgi:hypothetical protein
MRPWIAAAAAVVAESASCSRDTHASATTSTSCTATARCWHLRWQFASTWTSSHTAFVCPRSRRAMCAAISPTTLSCMQQCGERNASIGTDQHDDCGAVDEDRSRCVRARSEKHTNTMTDDYQEALVKAIEEHPAAVFIVMLVSSGEIDDFRVCADEGWFARWLVLCCVLRDARLTDYRKLNRRLRESRE